ncbi:DNA polymerase III subunit beta [Candidatus Giovannonibacteria bacterium RIFCSPLOWO2_12_FULL_44_25]|uniref:Beta sliding clamp n=3 Tax=Candidatus Giovannoniibacteriota TaxID=1752738 RepID=A0A0G1IDI9_9BACT|nr:MAG: polymerase III subunit beta protein [Parcubacteria group bacterium GW2011_GWC1_44_10]KKT56883.1 MAG: polymerase III subunit beta protein [Candidatus Giovannonibacteria bacterium GW2011_GWB1_44_23]KKT59452.1 MAG: polymerase III subunit beta protein [Candidatus Giovannonibacteria bacterium GW2011_GWA1_44_25]OGF49600.1 MAG: DNA polymerase III subunit beta [Candidatus Giovannonibacteria bacterium GWA2_45_15]OGF59910.1 MAG: DNA polymerase III subunit beta [Candidatus Giovannonibacteria bacte
MKLQCIINNLRNGIVIAERSAAKNQTLPILNSVFIDAEKDVIKLKSTNLETALEIIIPGKIIESGSIVVPAKILSSFLSNINDDQIMLQTNRNNLFIKANNIETTIQGYPKEDFPIFPQMNSQENFTMQARELKDGLSATIIAASISDIKPELSSVLFKIFKNTIKIAATDSFRLAEKTIISKKINKEKLISFLIPQKGVQEMLKLLDQDEILEIGINKNQFFLSGNRFKFISRLTDGKFPDYEQIMPKNFKTVAVSKKSDIVSHIKLASVFVGKLSDITFNFDPAKKAVLINAFNSDVGQHSAQINSMIQGESVEVKFNWRYLLDGISQIDNEYIEFNLNTPESPLLIKGKGDASYLYLVMPMRGA